MENIRTYYFENIGLVLISEKNNCINLVDVVKDKLIKGNETKLLLSAKQQLSEYFSGLRKTFDLNTCQAGTPFQIKVWDELKKIPYAKTISYKQLAINIGNPNASRAVGNANNKNNLTFIVPCHRVVGSNGKLVGYAHGIDIKNYLLDTELKNN